jgi:Uma2 family endonuclease
METIINIEKKTVRDYQLLSEGAAYQLINGQLIMAPAPRRTHQKLSGEIFRLIANYLHKKQIGETYFAPFDVYLDEENVVQPDICFIAQKNIGILSEEGANGSPDIVIELLSPSNAYYDLLAKYQLYEKFGVQEYFIVDPEDNLVIAYTLTEGRYKETYREHNKITSAILGTEISW